MAEMENDPAMKVVVTKNYPYCLQHLYLTNNCHEKYGFGSFALVNVSKNFDAVVKICSNDTSFPVNCCFIDFTVVVPRYKNFDFASIKINTFEIYESDFEVLEVIGDAREVELFVICNDASTVIKFRENEPLCVELIKDFLQQFVIVSRCFVFGESSPNLRCFSIFVVDVIGKQFDGFRITKKTKIVIKKVLSLQLSTQEYDPASFGLFYGELETPLKKICKIVETLVKRHHHSHLLLVGPPGAGKMSMITAIATELNGFILALSCEGIPLASLSEKLTQTMETAKLHVEAKELCIVVLKDVDKICVSRNGQLTVTSKRLIKQLKNHLMDISDKLTVIGTTASPEYVDGSLRRFGGFDEEIEIPVLKERDRQEAFEKLVLDNESCAKEIATLTPGYILGDFHRLSREAEKFMKIENLVERYKKAVALVEPSALKGTTGLIASVKTTFNDIGGLEKVKRFLKMSVQLQLTNPKAFLRFGIPPTRGILLHGPPGCAKTTLVKALAYETNATFIAVTAADIYSCYVGEAEKHLTKLFAHARMAAPSILFIDEIDGLVGSKDGDRDHGCQERILATLLLEMDGIGLFIRTSDSLSKISEKGDSREQLLNTEVIVVGATNRPEMIDDALKRPGRFDKLIYVPAPDYPERLNILKHLAASMALEDSVDLDYIAKNTESCSGADLKSICRESALHALTTNGMDVPKITDADFKEVLRDFKPSLKEPIK